MRGDVLVRLRTLRFGTSQWRLHQSPSQVELLLCALDPGGRRNRMKRTGTRGCGSLVGSLERESNGELTEPVVVLRNVADRQRFVRRGSLMLSTASVAELPKEPDFLVL